MMTDEEKANQITAVSELSTEESVKRLSILNDKKQEDLTDIEKVDYLVLKWNVEGKESFFADSYTTTLLQELILSWIEEERDIPEYFSNLFLICHVDWLIDWNNSSESHVVVRQDIVDNMHTFIMPFLEEIEEILGESYNSRARHHLKDRIINDIEGLVNYHLQAKLPQIYNALFKVKYALQGAREYMASNQRKSIKINSTDYQMDIQSIAHIFLRHTNRFKSLSHKDNPGTREFLKNVIGDENEELNNLLNTIEESASVTSGGILTCHVDNVDYKLIIKTGRIVTIYPID